MAWTSSELSLYQIYRVPFAHRSNLCPTRASYACEILQRMRLMSRKGNRNLLEVDMTSARQARMTSVYQRNQCDHIHMVCWALVLSLIHTTQFLPSSYIITSRFFTARVGKVEHSRYLPRDIVHRPGQHLIEISSQLRSCQSSFLIIKLCACFAITAAPSHAPLRDISQALTVVLRAVAVLDLQCES